MPFSGGLAPPVNCVACCHFFYVALVVEPSLAECSDVDVVLVELSADECRATFHGIFAVW